ncbi:uncharacterized protein BT62DRAFT_965229 [Guyanagaster necrorhizus]|uniref:DUF6593 domain-containing protein n=1 Tax=Guyanagaster necrorhizus TaxID=856835 RepID=A0A9P7VY45_9AGAR|nr:uncharacterized protein BT62DRAFT_965229 [Guyanagaster necrorhizus MCA 3950]KAG7448707.1 hypothetical protein BT62DRAFT_965229 [Guyanagaster necrorhizus MCA 3950]
MSFNDIYGGWGQGPAPSMFGALPYPTPPGPANYVTFYLTSFNPSVLNCTVIGPQQRPFFAFITDSNMPTYTVLKDAKDRNIALVEWQPHPLVELRGVISKQKVKDWLRLSQDKASRTMDVCGTRYLWIPREQYINLYSSGSSSRLLARICRGHGTITLDIAAEAMQLGLLDATIIATMLLQCGQNID